jgi:hypothetical protein
MRGYPRNATDAVAVFPISANPTYSANTDSAIEGHIGKQDSPVAQKQYAFRTKRGRKPQALELKKGETLISDYTVLALGTRVDGGEVRVCPKCHRPGLNVEMDGHSFYTHFQILKKDDPRNSFLRRVECHLLAGEVMAHSSSHALPRYASPSS